MAPDRYGNPAVAQGSARAASTSAGRTPFQHAHGADREHGSRHAEEHGPQRHPRERTLIAMEMCADPGEGDGADRGAAPIQIGGVEGKPRLLKAALAVNSSPMKNHIGPLIQQKKISPSAAGPFSAKSATSW